MTEQKSLDLNQIVFNVLDDNKAVDITSIDIREMTNIADTMIIASATSSRHAKTLADKVIEAAKSHGVKPFSTQGEDTGEWVLIDLLDVVVHIMLPDIREFYSLEKLWNVTLDTREKSASK